MAVKLPNSTLVDSVPTVAAGRTSEPNPFDPIIKELDKTRGKSRVFVFPYKSDDDKATVASVKNAAHRAGRAANVSARVKIEEDSRKGTATVTVWVVDKITRSTGEHKGKESVK